MQILVVVAINKRFKKSPFITNAQKKKSEPPSATYTISLPLSSMYHKISTIFKEHNVRVIPAVNKSMQNIITRGKDKCKLLDRNNVVYKFECNNCDAVYVGETKRKLRQRRCEHKNNNNADAVINVHKSSFGHDFKWDRPKILDNERHWGKRIVSEMLHIKSHPNAINKKEDVSKLSNLYSTIIKYLM